MAKFELIMPKMGESIMEATITKWVKKEGDTIEVDETILEIATDKVDSEIPSPVSGTIEKILFKEDEVVGVGTAIAVIATESEGAIPEPSPAFHEHVVSERNVEEMPHHAALMSVDKQEKVASFNTNTSNRFYSPLVKTIAQKENISPVELEQINGSGLKGRVTKKDILAYLEQRQAKPSTLVTEEKNIHSPMMAASTAAPITSNGTASKSISGEMEIVEMDRMRRLIAEHMVRSKHTSPHVTSFIEIDVTNIVNWRNRIKADFEKKYKEKITYTPIFIEATAKALRDFPMVNVSVDGHNILVKKNINIGMATALPSGNLIVPVINNADYLNLTGLSKKVNDLAKRARNNALKPEEIQGGTFTITNVGTFGNVMGTPIINQPQAAILSTGIIKKKPAVLETEYGDVIAIRHLMFLSLSYDHRVVDGMLGGSFLRKIGDYLEAFDGSQTI